MKNKIDIKREILKEKLEEKNLREWKDILDKWKLENPDIHPRNSIYLKQKSFELQEKINNELEKYDNENPTKEKIKEKNFEIEKDVIIEKLEKIENGMKPRAITNQERKLKDLLYTKLSRNKELLDEVFKEVELVDDHKKQKLIL